MFGCIVLYGLLSILCWIFPYEKPERAVAGNGPKPKYRMKEVENEGELFFTDATDFNEAFKF